MHFTHVPERNSSEFNSWDLHTGLYTTEAWKLINSILDGINDPWVMSNAPINTVWGRCLRASDGECIIGLAATSRDHAMNYVWPAVREKILGYDLKCKSDDERDILLHLIGDIHYTPEKFVGRPWNPLKVTMMSMLYEEWKYAWENGVIENGQLKFEAIKKLMLDAANLN